MLGQPQAERKRGALRGRRDRTEAKVEGRTEFGTERIVVECQQAHSLFIRNRPDDRTASVSERQESKRSARQKALPRRRLVRAFVRNVRDDATLSVITILRRDAKQAAQ